MRAFSSTFNAVETELPSAPEQPARRLKAHERNRIILEAAKRILVTEGFSALSLRYVAEKSGIRLASLQYYYKTKEQLFRAAFEDALAKEREQINRLVVRAGNSPESALRARISGHYKANLHDETAGFFYQLWARARLAGFAAELMDEFYERNVAILADMVSAFNPSLSSAEARRRTVFTMAALEGMTMFVDIDKRRKRKVSPSEKYVVNQLMEFLGQPAPPGRGGG